MTPGTGMRSSRACLRCRRRKTKCNLDGYGEPQKPPCLSCHQSGSECVLIQSKRGNGSSKRRQRRVPSPMGGRMSPEHTPRLQITPSNQEAEYIDESDNSFDVEDQYQERETDENLRMELRNPSDALQILARSGESPSHGSPCRRQPASGIQSEVSINGLHSSHTHTANSVDGSIQTSRNSNNGIPPTTVLDEYELVQRGLLHPSVLPELLHLFSQNYHPYCPITPSYMLGPTAMESIQRSDHFLLTALLTIASRDSPNHALIHRYCWDYTQRLLLDVLLAQPWAHTTRTVEGLLLLAEWLPHVQTKQIATEAPKSLFGEDRMAWSLIGLAVRQGYLLRLDRAAFRVDGDNESKKQEEQKRLVWTFVYLADRQISVRLGQSFWSRGPSLASPFTAKDYPSLKPVPGVKTEDYASALHATLELTQILYNAHGILYSSTDRTLTMVHDGDYARYLDDFLRSASTWYSTWKEIQVPHNIKSTLMLMYEYICLYVNAFSFQAVLTRASASRSPFHKEDRTTRRPLAELFSNGIMASPDGRYIFDAISAAKNLLGLMNDLDPRRVLCYLPSRYYLYGVYAAVFLHKAQSAGAFTSTTQRREVTNLALRFISTMEEAPSTQSHIGHGYGRMLRNLWSRRDSRRGTVGKDRAHPDAITQDSTEQIPVECDSGTKSTFIPPSASSERPEGNQISPTGSWGDPASIGPLLPETFGLGDDISSFPTIEGYLFGSFLPGITDLQQQNGFEGNNGEPTGCLDG